MPAWVIPAIAGAASIVAGIIGKRAAKKQSEENWKIAQFQMAANERYQDKQNMYNTPANQMLRFGSAGLNPNLIYGQGNPGNQAAPLHAPDVRAADYQEGSKSIQAALLQLGPLINQSMMTQSQVGATDAKARQIGVLTQLNELQAEVLRKNPLLDQSGFKAIIDSLVSTAEIKASESGIRKSEMFVQQASAGFQVSKIFQEIQLLEQRFKLAQLDEKLKAEVLNTKEFQNAILEVQKKWMTEADITPQHIYQFIQMLLLKLF